MCKTQKILYRILKSSHKTIQNKNQLYWRWAKNLRSRFTNEESAPSPEHMKRSRDGAMSGLRRKMRSPWVPQENAGKPAKRELTHGSAGDHPAVTPRTRRAISAYVCPQNGHTDLEEDTHRNGWMCKCRAEQMQLRGGERRRSDTAHAARTQSRKTGTENRLLPPAWGAGDRKARHAPGVGLPANQCKILLGQGPCCSRTL